MEDVLNMNIIDFIVEDDSYIIYTDPNDFITVKDDLINCGYNKFIMSEVTFVPKQLYFTGSRRDGKGF